MKRRDNNVWYQHEGLDRTHMLICMLEEAFSVNSEPHPSLHNKKCKKLVKKAERALAELYQKIGEWESANPR